MLALRRHYLPHEKDDIDNLARAIWLDEHHQELLAMAVNKGIAKSFGK
ncbi:DUF6890 family protein [Vibrio jasicida]|uniref:DUF6890 family protein n=1 Tax=Vibrio jasicida TaxID=766224 RepID=A0ABW7JH65_9VIBR